MNRVLGTSAAFALSLAMALPASADPATLLGVFGNWSAYSSGTGSSLTCYALSTPRASAPKAGPKTFKRSPVYLMLSDWPGRRVKGEPQIVYGYQVKEGAPAALGVGSDKFTFFMRNSGKDGSAWLQALNDNPRLVGAMQSGVSAVASGTSTKGTRTTDTYSLQGFNDALTKIHAVCQM